MESFTSAASWKSPVLLAGQPLQRWHEFKGCFGELIAYQSIPALKRYHDYVMQDEILAECTRGLPFLSPTARWCGLPIRHSFCPTRLLRVTPEVFDLGQKNSACRTMPM